MALTLHGDEELKIAIGEGQFGARERVHLLERSADPALRAALEAIAERDDAAVGEALAAMEPARTHRP